jgi:hypothetical protein
MRGCQSVIETKRSTYFCASVCPSSSTADRLTEMKADGLAFSSLRCAITKAVIVSWCCCWCTDAATMNAWKVSKSESGASAALSRRLLGARIRECALLTVRLFCASDLRWFHKQLERSLHRSDKIHVGCRTGRNLMRRKAIGQSSPFCQRVSPTSGNQPPVKLRGNWVLPTPAAYLYYAPAAL